MIVDPQQHGSRLADGSRRAAVSGPSLTSITNHPTLCGSQRNDLAAIPQDVQDILAAPWSLLTDRQYRAWPPWPCQTCVGTTERKS